MNTHQLECFVRVADKLNFTKAAEELFITTPAVTHQIKSLEEELGTTLFIRTSKMVKLTETGILFYGEARDILQKMALAEKKVKKLANRELAVLRISCTSQTELPFLQNGLTRLREAFPQTHPQIIIQDYSHLKSLFDNKQIDIAVATKEMLAGARDCIFRKVRTIRSFAIVREDSPLASRDEIPFRDLMEVPLITLHPRAIPFQYGNKLQEFLTLHAQKHFHILCENDQSAILLARCGYGVAVLPEIYLTPQMEGVIAVPFSEKQVLTEYGIAYHKTEQEKHIRQFIKYFTE